MFSEDKNEKNFCFIFLFSLAIISFSCFANEQDHDVVIVAEQLRHTQSPTSSENLFEFPDIDRFSPEELKNQMAVRDLDRLQYYLTNHKEEPIYNLFAGCYIDSNNNAVIMFSSFNDDLYAELDNLNFETAVDLLECKGSYFENQKIMSRMNEQLSAINTRFLKGEASEKEAELMLLYPSVRYNDIENTINVWLASEDEDLLSQIALFQDLIETGSDVIFTACRKEDVCGWDYSVTARPGCGVYIPATNDHCSLGFRCYYTSDGETHYGMITCAHSNILGNQVKLCPSWTTGSILGYVTIRQLYGSVDASFVELLSDVTTNQSIHYTSYSHMSDYLDGYIGSIYKGQIIYKSGWNTGFTSGTIEETSIAEQINGIYFSNMFSATPASMASGGDSGGITYYITSGSTGRTIGVKS